MSGRGRYRKGHDTPPRGKAAAERWRNSRLRVRILAFGDAVIRETPFTPCIGAHRAWPDNQVR